MTVVQRRPQAVEDIAEVWDHIADDSLRAADRWVDQLDEQFQLLATQPLMGRARGDLSPRLRSFPFGRYLIFYEPVEDGIDVVRLLHSARDVDAVFGDAGTYVAAWRRSSYSSAGMSEADHVVNVEAPLAPYPLRHE